MRLWASLTPIKLNLSLSSIPPEQLIPEPEVDQSWNPEELSFS